jgi:hypothetical protein
MSIRLRSDRWPLIRNVSANLGASTARSWLSSPYVFGPAIKPVFLVGWFIVHTLWPLSVATFPFPFISLLSLAAKRAFSPTVVADLPRPGHGCPRGRRWDRWRPPERGTGRSSLALAPVFRRCKWEVWVCVDAVELGSSMPELPASGHHFSDAVGGCVARVWVSIPRCSPFLSHCLSCSLLYVRLHNLVF